MDHEAVVRAGIATDLPLDRSIVIPFLQERLRTKLAVVQRRARVRILSETDLSMFLERLFEGMLQHRSGHGVLSGGRVSGRYFGHAASTLIRVYWWRHCRGISLSYFCERVNARSPYHTRRNAEYYLTFYSRTNDLERGMSIAAPARYYRLVQITDNWLRKQFAGWSEIPKSVKLRHVERRWPRAVLLRTWYLPALNLDNRWVLISRGLPFSTLLVDQKAQILDLAVASGYSVSIFRRLIRAKDDKEVIAAVLEGNHPSGPKGV